MNYFDNKWDLLGTSEEIDWFINDLIKDIDIKLSPMDSLEGCISFNFDLNRLFLTAPHPIMCEVYYVNKFTNKHLVELQLWFKSSNEMVNEDIINKVYAKYNLENMNTFYNYKKDMTGMIKLRHKFKIKKSSQVNREYIARIWISKLPPAVRKQYYKEDLAINWAKLDKDYNWEVFWYNYTISVLNNRAI